MGMSSARRVRSHLVGVFGFLVQGFLSSWFGPVPVRSLAMSDTSVPVVLSLLSLRSLLVMNLISETMVRYYACGLIILILLRFWDKITRVSYCLVNMYDTPSLIPFAKGFIAYPGL